MRISENRMRQIIREEVRVIIRESDESDELNFFTGKHAGKRSSHLRQAILEYIKENDIEQLRHAVDDVIRQFKDGSPSRQQGSSHAAALHATILEYIKKMPDDIDDDDAVDILQSHVEAVIRAFNNDKDQKDHRAFLKKWLQRS